MARLDQFPDTMRSHLANLPCPSFPTTPWATGPGLSKRRVALISTAGIHRRGDRPFESMSGDYRLIPGGIPAGELVMTHISTNFDRTGFQQDWNVVFPLDRLGELAQERCGFPLNSGARWADRWTPPCSAGCCLPRSSCSKRQMDRCSRNFPTKRQRILETKSGNPRSGPARYRLQHRPKK